MVWMIWGCANETSTKETVDSVGKSIDERFNRVADSAKRNLKNLKNRIERRVEGVDSSVQK